MTDMGHSVDPSLATEQVAQAIMATLALTARGQREAASPLTGLIEDYEHNFGLQERDALRRAFAIVLERASKNLDDPAYKEIFPDMLYFGGRILVVRELRQMLSIQRYIRKSLANALRIDEKDLALACLNFYVSTGLTENSSLLQTWAQDIGPQAIVSTFMIMAQRSPEEAVNWIVSEDVPQDVARQTFKATLEAVDSGTYGIEAGLVDHRRMNWWAKAQFERALRAADSQFSKELLSLLRGEEIAQASSTLFKGRSLEALRSIRDHIPLLNSQDDQRWENNTLTSQLEAATAELENVQSYNPNALKASLIERIQ